MPKQKREVKRQEFEDEDDYEDEEFIDDEEEEEPKKKAKPSSGQQPTRAEILSLIAYHNSRISSYADYLIKLERQ